MKQTMIPYALERLAPAAMQQRADTFYELMNRRRTVRQFAPDPIPEGVLERAILTAGTAPSGYTSSLGTFVWSRTR